MVLHLHEARPLWSIPEWAVEEIRAALPEGWVLEVVDEPADGRGDGGADSPGALAAVRGAEVYVGFGMPPALFEAATAPPEGRLRWAHTASAGVGGSLHPAMVASDVVLTNAAGVYAEPMADTVLAMILHFARGMDVAVRAQAARRWEKAAFEARDTPMREIAGATLGILGLGGIGRAVARRGLALGMEVLATRRRGTEGPDGVRVVTGDGGTDEVLRAAHYVVVALPQTAETRGMLDARRIAAMRRDAVLVNVARGGVVDEDALADALRAGRLRGAGLDVFAREPLPAASPLWGLPNVLVTPHVSGASPRFWRRQADLIIDNIRRYARGQPLRNAVDKQAGY